MTIHSNFHADLERIADHHVSQLPAVQARQGVMLGRMRFVLSFGLALVMVAFAIIYLIFT